MLNGGIIIKKCVDLMKQYEYEKQTFNTKKK